MDIKTENKRMGRKVAVMVTSLFLLVIIAWTILFNIALNNQPEKVELDPVETLVSPSN